jgi:hypothetical protein
MSKLGPVLIVESHVDLRDGIALILELDGVATVSSTM